MAKRLNSENSIQDVLKAFIQTNKLSVGIDKVEAKEAWFAVLGSGVANYTEEVVFKNNTLYVKLTSSVLREELSHGKSKIIKLLNEELKKELITNLVLR